MGLFGFADKILEYNNLGFSLNNIYGNLLEIENRINSNPYDGSYVISLYEMSFLYVKGVLKRIEKYNYDVSGKIVVPQISSKPITLYFALASVGGKIAELQIKNIFEKEINDKIGEILNGGKYYFSMEEYISKDVVKNLIKC